MVGPDADQGAAGLVWCSTGGRHPGVRRAAAGAAAPLRAGARLPRVPVPSCKPSASALRVTCTTSWAHSSSTRWRCCTAARPDREAQAALEQCMLDLRFVVDRWTRRASPSPPAWPACAIDCSRCWSAGACNWVEHGPAWAPREPNPHSAEQLASVARGPEQCVAAPGATKVDINVRYVPATDRQAEVCDNGRGLT